MEYRLPVRPRQDGIDDCHTQLTGLHVRRRVNDGAPRIVRARHAQRTGSRPLGFSLVPWKPVIEQRLEQQIAATVSGSGVS
ncbi:hypothetical protein P3W85_00535 [Cupriavidus basilensis]|uniref:Uncharacterized protein n=1 Tax=Cupriavidus basilensis TaxID=68895 RepID=A0ABT6AFT8_9BURK|nr:hypothetical protein [Cupriavidus basilensis]MDF3831455.1 hypothetical protein [Cupriavidus basilensis]